MLGMEVPGLNSGKFLCTFLPRSDCSISVSQSHNFTFVWFLQLCSYNSSVIQTIKRYCYDDQPMYTPIFKLFLYSVYPVAVTEV